MKDALISKAIAARRESRHIEFKESFDVDSRRDWCEIIKDVVAMANSGGGLIIFGADSKGSPVSFDSSSLASIDPATVADRVHSYTESHAVEIEIVDVKRGSRSLVGWLVAPSATPLVFTKPGTSPVDAKKQHTSFGIGTVYFRHGAKSEPGTTEDIARAFEDRLETIRKEWTAGVRKIVQAPAGSRVSVLPPEVREVSVSDAIPIRVTDDPSAPAYRVVDPDVTHPHRQTELIAEVRKKLPQGVNCNGFDITSVRRVHRTDERKDFTHKPRFATRQYSQAFVEWLAAKATADPEFFEKARAEYRRG
jgi:hypothetical protein